MLSDDIYKLTRTNTALDHIQHHRSDLPARITPPPARYHHRRPGRKLWRAHRRHPCRRASQIKRVRVQPPLVRLIPGTAILGRRDLVGLVEFDLGLATVPLLSFLLLLPLPLLPLLRFFCCFRGAVRLCLSDRESW